MKDQHSATVPRPSKTSLPISIRLGDIEWVPELKKNGAPDSPYASPLADKFLYSTAVPANTYQRTKFQLPSRQPHLA